MSNFKEATKQKLRFSTSKGVLSTEQLWELSLSELTTCIKNTKKLLKSNDDDDLSFLDINSKVDVAEQLRFDVLKEVYLTKKSDQDAIRKAKDDKEHNQKIMEILSTRKESALHDKSDDELLALLR